MTTRVIVAHGIGQHDKDFHEEWKVEMERAHPDGDFEVVGLWWDDLLDKVGSRWRIVSERLADRLTQIGFDQLNQLRSSTAGEILREFVMDVLVYAVLGEARSYLQTACAIRLLKLAPDPANTVLIGHSLGSALLTHLVALENREMGAIGYKGMILLAPPFGARTPITGIGDLVELTPTVPRPSADNPFLAVLGLDPGTVANDQPFTRSEILGQVADTWAVRGARALHLLLNERDIICSEARFKVGSKLIDPLPFMTTGLDARERSALARANLIEFKGGGDKIGDLAKNHAVSLYLKRAEFEKVFKELVP